VIGKAFPKEDSVQTNGWVQEFAGAVTVCDVEGVILEINDRAAQMFRKDGGRELIGSNVLDCHPERARGKLARLLETQQRNVYTIEKGGVTKLIYQSPWYERGEYRGFVELALKIPASMPHFVRDLPAEKP
jgi:PAS domain-containing protein